MIAGRDGIAALSLNAVAREAGSAKAVSCTISPISRR
jgi:hypothetical protein